MATTTKKVSLDETIDVKSCFMGKLNWTSRKTGYNLKWNEFGDVNPMTVSELLDMRNGDRRFFEEHWVSLVGERAKPIMEYLQIAKYYKDINTVDDIDVIFTYSPDEIVAIVSNFDNHNKELVALRAASLIKEDKLDSLKVIAAIKEATGYGLEI